MAKNKSAWDGQIFFPPALPRQPSAQVFCLYQRPKEVPAENGL
jgi:hypothetical protein